MTQPHLDFVFFDLFVSPDDLLLLVLVLVFDFEFVLVVFVLLLLLDDFTGVEVESEDTRFVLIVGGGVVVVVGDTSTVILVGDAGGCDCCKISLLLSFNKVELGDGNGVVELIVAFNIIWFISCSCFSFNFWTNSSASLANSPSGLNGLSFGDSLLNFKIIINLFSH